MFPRAGSQIFTEPGSPEDFHPMKSENVSRDEVNVTGFSRIASSKWTGTGVEMDPVYGVTGPLMEKWAVR
jgi:hypothetical protein